MSKKFKIGTLISGGGSNLRAIMDACENGRIDATVSFAGSDSPGAKGLDRAEKCNIPVFVVDYADIIRECEKNPDSIEVPPDFDLDDVFMKQNLFPPGTDRIKVEKFLKRRAVAEHRLLEKIGEYSFDLLVLAGFMRTLTPYFIDRINTDRNTPRIINIHPALLPAFPGIDGYGDTFRYGCKVGGCTVHFIDYGEDTGPIIGQKAFEILPGETLEEVRAKGLRLEWELYPECIRLFAENRLRLKKTDLSKKSGVAKTRNVVEIMEPV